MALMHQTRLGFAKAAMGIRRAHGYANGYARPLYEAVKPLLHYRGIDTSIPDKALQTYDGIRRAVGH